MAELGRVRVPRAVDVLRGESPALFQLLQSVDILHGALKAAQDLVAERGSYGDLMVDCERLLVDLTAHVPGSSHPLPDSAHLGKC